MFQVVPLSIERFSHLFNLDDEALKGQGVVVQIADSRPGYPCRVSLQNAAVGERVWLLNYEHQPADSPFRSRHAIYIRERAERAVLAPGELPEALFSSPLLSVRAFNAEGMIVAAELTPGPGAGAVFNDLLARDGVDYLHAHFARYGCYAARIDRSVTT